MEQTFLLVVVLATSLFAGGVGVRWLGLPPALLRAAVRRMLQTLGLTAVFVALNIATGLGALVLMRGLRGSFVSLYPGLDLTVLVLSLLQALVATRWWDLASGASR